MKLIVFMILSVVGSLSAQSIYSDPIGFTKVTCLTTSDTIVGVPFRVQGSQNTKLSSAPVLNGTTATLTLAANNLTAGALTNHYVKFKSGAKDGYWYDIDTATPNTANTVTIKLNGDTLTGVATDDTLVIAEFWTLDTLFPPAGVTSSWTETPVGSGNWVPNGHAIVASTNTLTTGRRTEILMPNVVSPGTNIPVEGRYYINGGVWKRSGQGNTNYGAQIRFYPDTLFTISNPSTVTHATIFRSMGEVEPKSMIIPLTTQDAVAQDNFIAIPRPINVTLDGLNLRQSAGAFMASSNTLTTGRRDQLMVYNNELQLRNKAPSLIYYVHGGIWKLSGDGNNDHGTDVIPASAGFIIRKYKVTGHPTAFWINTPTY